MDTDSRDAATASVPIDAKTIQELREEGGDLLSELVQMFIDEVPGQLAVLEAALVKEDAGATRLTAHKLKGTAGNFGASRMQTLASALETKGRDGSLQGAAALFVQLQAECQRVRAALEAAR
jgi:HPt (histidine-containing phosphotransfer) domain-containing protein